MSYGDDLNEKISQISKNDLREEFKRFAEDPAKLEAELNNFADSVSKKDILDAIQKLGGPDKLVEKILLFFAYKASLVRKGLTFGIATGAAAGLCFGVGALGHRIADYSGCGSLEDLACDFDTMAQHTSRISEDGFQLAHESIDFFQEAAEAFQAVFA